LALAVTHPRRATWGAAVPVAYPGRVNGRWSRSTSARWPPPPRTPKCSSRERSGPHAPSCRRQGGRRAVPCAARFDPPKLWRTPWARARSPAARRAREGFPFAATLARSLNQHLFAGTILLHRGARTPSARRRPARRFPPLSVRAFGKPDGTRWSAATGSSRRPGRQPRPDRRIRPRWIATPAHPAASGLATVRHGGLISSTPAHTGAGPPGTHSPPRIRRLRPWVPPVVGSQRPGHMLQYPRTVTPEGGRPLRRDLHRVTEAMRRGFVTSRTEISDPFRLRARLEADLPVPRDSIAASIGVARPKRRARAVPDRPARESTRRTSRRSTTGNGPPR